MADIRHDLEELKRTTGIISDGTVSFTPWIGVDLDGTLAYYDEWRGIEYIGAPIWPMVGRIYEWLNEGKTVKIFTARCANDGAVPYITKWLSKIGLGELEVTNIKDYGLTVLYDDRARQVEFNTGRLLVEE